jgi:hypothetical protein
MPPIWTFTDKKGNVAVREMTAEEWAFYPQAKNEIVIASALPEPTESPE